ncbi:MAG: glycosyl transferase family 4, partial [Gammaproteobacteria bacterium]|nr:glycosyl transferase family 4 [Gammaproteobacteria bacterium]
GFLLWNRPPARIFMGDAGSYGLGAMFAVFLVAGAAGVGTAWLVAMLTGVFICDATLTLLARVLRGERFHEAHRQHAYQRMVQCGWSHGRVLAVFTLINLLWCWPLAALSLFEPDLGPVITTLCFAGLCGLWLAAQHHYAAHAQAS